MLVLGGGAKRKLLSPRALGEEKPRAQKFQGIGFRV